MSYKILLLWSNPIDSDDLRLHKEENLIKDCIQRNPGVDFEVTSRGGVKEDEFWTLIIEHKPNLIHLSGHGTENNEFCFEDGEDYEELVEIDRIIKYLNGIQSINCLILNSCFSANSIKASDIEFEYLIGMGSEIPNQSASRFSSSFYSAFFQTKKIKDSFKIALPTINSEDANIPRLIESISKKVETEVETISDLISEEEMISVQKSIKQFWFPSLTFIITLALGLYLVQSPIKNEDRLSEIVGLLIIAAGGIFSLFHLRGTMVKIKKFSHYRIKRNRYIKAFSSIDSIDVKALNSAFENLIS